MKKDVAVLFFLKTELDNIYRNLTIAMLKIASQVQSSDFRVKVIDSRAESDFRNSIINSL